MDQLTKPALSDSALKKLLQRLDSPLSSIREPARREAKQLPPDILLRLMALEARSYRSHKRAMWANSFLYSLFFTLPILLLLPILFSSFFTAPAFWIGVGLGIPVYGLYVYCFYTAWTQNTARRPLVTLLEEVEDVRFVAPMLPMLVDKSEESQSVRPALVSMLARLLPRLRPGDVAAWTPEQHHDLRALLDYPVWGKDLTLLVLQALEAVGTQQDVAVVAELASQEEKDVQVREAAQQCLEVLRLRLEQQRQAQMLLRPAAMPTQDMPTTLLRPAGPAATEIPPEQLLRAVSPQE